MIFTFSALAIACLLITLSFGDTFQCDPLTVPDPLSLYLFQVCSNDTVCNDLYFHGFKPNSTLFNALTRSLLFGKTFDHPISSLVCGQTANAINDRLWLLLLSVERFNQPTCGPNFKPVFDPDSVQMECVCAHDKMCHIIERDKVLSYTIAGLMLLISMVVACISLYRVCLDVQMLKKQCAGDKNSMDQFLKKLW